MARSEEGIEYYNLYCNNDGILFSDVDTELTCPAQADVTRDQTTGWGITQH